MQTTNQANQAEVEAKLETGRHHFVLIFGFTVFYSRITQPPSTAAYLSKTKFDNVISISSSFNPSDFNLPDADCWDPTYSFTWTHGTRIHIKEQPTTWNEEKGQPLFTLLKESKNKACIIFTTMKEFNTNISAEQLKDSKLKLGQLEKLHLERQQKLQEWFPQTPAVFWSDTCVLHNGFFGSHISTSPTSSSTDQIANSAAANHQQVMSTYFRLIVKTLLSAKAQDQDFASATSNAASYRWDEMSFLSSSFDTKSLLLCFDVPANSITNLYQTLPKASDQILSNTISQRDSKVNKEMSNFSSQIALATREDGAAMKTIAVVTLTFLPATFVTALLGMNFFTVDSNVPGGRLTSTKDVWIFFVIAVPLTTIVLCFWWWWQRREAKRARNHNGSRSEKDIERSGDSSS
ncbi:hypothetical protein KCU67_g8786, partial [Aureobasidium melanogenum]